MCRGCGSRSATRARPRSMPGPRNLRSGCWGHSKPCRSAAGSPRRRRRATTSRFGSSPPATRSQASAEAAVARILIAEDEEPLRALVTRALAEDGHAVAATADGAEALETLQSENGGFDLLLADIKMPVMDGIALA